MTTSDLVLLSKQGINTYAGLESYIKDAVIHARNHELVSGIDRNEWIVFNSFNSYTRAWNHYEAILEQNLKKFDIYLVYENTKRQMGSVPVSSVLSTAKMKKFGLPVKSTVKSAKPKSKPKVKPNTASATKKTRRKSNPKTKRTKKAKTAKKSRSRKRK